MLSGKVYFKESDIDALLKNGMNPK